MPENRHAVKVRIGSPLELTKADITFEVRRDGERFGTLLISRGAVVWKPRSGKKNFKVGWAKFDQLMSWGRKTAGT
jgi:hypothetical protein